MAAATRVSGVPTRVYKPIVNDGIVSVSGIACNDSCAGNRPRLYWNISDNMLLFNIREVAALYDAHLTIGRGGSRPAERNTFSALPPGAQKFP